MNFQKIVFPTDFSTASDAGLAVATALARDSGATLVVVHVEEQPVAFGGGELYYAAPEPDHVATAQMLNAVVPNDPDVPCEHRMVTGDPAAEIVRVAEDERADMIVMGTHGRAGISRLLMGSVAEHVVRWAKCPVLTIKQPVAAEAAEHEKPVGAAAF